MAKCVVNESKDRPENIDLLIIAHEPVAVGVQEAWRY